MAMSSSKRSGDTAFVRLIAEVAGADPNADRFAALRHAIFDGILYDRLEEHRRKSRLLELLRNVDLHVEPVGEARFFDVEVESLEIDLLGQRHIGARIE